MEIWLKDIKFLTLVEKFWSTETKLMMNFFEINVQASYCKASVTKMHGDFCFETTVFWCKSEMM